MGLSDRLCLDYLAYAKIDRQEFVDSDLILDGLYGVSLLDLFFLGLGLCAFLAYRVSRLFLFGLGIREIKQTNVLV